MAKKPKDTRMPWIKKSETIDGKASNAILIDKNWKTACTRKFLFKMRSHQLTEGTRVVNFKKRFQRVIKPGEERCPHCKRPEESWHIFQVCPHTEKERQELHQKVKQVVKAHSRRQISKFPCWWDPKIACQNSDPAWLCLETFNPVWGIQGIIPKQLQEILQFHFYIEKQESRKVLQEIQLELESKY